MYKKTFKKVKDVERTVPKPIEAKCKDSCLQKRQAIQLLSDSIPTFSMQDITKDVRIGLCITYLAYTLSFLHLDSVVFVIAIPTFLAICKLYFFVCFFLTIVH